MTTNELMIEAGVLTGQNIPSEAAPGGLAIPNGVTAIGPDAFCNCGKLTIHAPADSYAEAYARENGISFAAI